VTSVIGVESMGHKESMGGLETKMSRRRVKKGKKRENKKILDFYYQGKIHAMILIMLTYCYLLASD